MAPLVVLVGTGTSVGKTYVAERLLRALAADGHAALGYKPVESGVSDLADTDIGRIARASTFHVKPPLTSLTFSAPVSPHVAARMEGRRVDAGVIRSEVARGCATEAKLFVVELPGGAFSPLTDELSGVEFARALPGVRAILVARDRLGVLHDVAATARACAACGLPLLGVVLCATRDPDPSVDTNASELRTVTRLPLLARLPFAPAESAVAEGDAALALSRLLVR